ncbi:hypothetical protein [Salinisphaera sp. G21_0]|uniref:hypothetical protein n=1 Tax=Salinisphaera sp. G21_0 TaxID=2821094 RepID=UPI001AD9DE26|nr:hypothetical protein [Salinisphaera sp. G21_0]MBO9483992.1 hypothetical protein [Salinisphaera sp. G21_0]
MTGISRCAYIGESRGQSWGETSSTSSTFKLTACWLLASGFWLLASGFWLLAAGCWPQKHKRPAFSGGGKRATLTEMAKLLNDSS